MLNVVQHTPKTSVFDVNWQIPIALTSIPNISEKMPLLHSVYNTIKSISIPAFLKRLIPGAPGRLPKRPTVQSLPNELLLEIFSFLELKPYLISHGVCKTWRQLLPSTKLDPTRERLLHLYHRILNTPDFQKTLEWTDKNLQPFDREAYIACLLAQYPAIPDEYRIWILEWPARLAIRSTWPGLPFINCRTISQVFRRTGVNWIAYEPTSPRLSALVYKLDTPSQMYIPGLYIWRWANTSDWLIFEEDEPDLFGRVFILQAEYHRTGSIPFIPPRDSDSEEEEDEDEEAVMYRALRVPEEEFYLTTFDDWIAYLEFLWDITAEEILCPRDSSINPDRPIPRPLFYEFDSPYVHNLPAPMWDSYNSTINP